MNWTSLLAAAFLVAIPLCAQAPVDSAPPEAGDPPGRVARLNWLTGDVAFQPAGLDEWTSATLNYPLTTSDHLFTQKDARAELHIGANVIRLDGGSNFGFINLDDSIVEVSLTEGSIQIHLVQLPADDRFEVATPNGAITLLEAGDYRVDTNVERDATMLTVRSGSAELFYGANSVIVHTQETAFFQTDEIPDIRTENASDDFDAFVVSRGDAGYSEPRNDRGGVRYAYDSSTIPEMVAEGMTGAEDLANYGSWQYTSGLGQTWVPPVEAGWVPYSNGNWAYVEPWGWTWVDAAPWGFAPFHYGRWAYVGGRWVWDPGRRRKTQVYAPALVSFIGGGPADRVSWVALGPPSYRSIPGAVVSLSQRDFVAGGRARPETGIMPEGSVLGSSPNVMPTSESILMRPSRLRPMVSNRPLILRTAPPPPPLAPIARTTLVATQRPPMRFTRPLPVKPVGPVKRPAAVSGAASGATGAAQPGAAPLRR